MSGLHLPVFEREPPSRPAEPRDHLVGNEQHLVPGADLTNERPVVLRGIEDTAGALNRLSDDGRDGLGTLPQDGLLDLARRRLPDGFARTRALEAVGVRILDVDESRDARLERVPIARAHARGTHGLQRQPVIGLRAGNHLHLVRPAGGLPVEARRLERRFVRLRAARREEHGLEAVGRQADQPVSQCDRRDVRSADVARAEGQLAHLFGRGVGQLLAPVADVDVPQAGQAVDVLAAVDVIADGTAPTRPDDRVEVVARMVQRVNEMRVIEGNELCSGPGHQCHRKGVVEELMFLGFVRTQLCRRICIHQSGGQWRWG